MSHEMGLPDMKKWRYAVLGACWYCGNDEAPGVRLYARRVPIQGMDYERPRCCSCARKEDRELADVATKVEERQR